MVRCLKVPLALICPMQKLSSLSLLVSEQNRRPNTTGCCGWRCWNVRVHWDTIRPIRSREGKAPTGAEVVEPRKKKYKCNDDIWSLQYLRRCTVRRAAAAPTGGTKNTFGRALNRGEINGHWGSIEPRVWNTKTSLFNYNNPFPTPLTI